MDIKNFINIKNFNGWTVLSILVLLAGLLFYLWWGMKYGNWGDIGTYSVTVFFGLSGLVGILLSLTMKKNVEQ
jgi:hypothetical protein